MWIKDEFVLLGNLNVEVRIVLVEVCLYTTVNLCVISVDIAVLHHTVLYAAESKEWLEAQGCCAVAVEKGVADEDAHRIYLEDDFLP